MRRPTIPIPLPTIKLQPYVPYDAVHTSLEDFAVDLGTKNDPFYGIYIVRSDNIRSVVDGSDKKEKRYRLGVSGVSHSNQGGAGLRQRLEGHAKPTPTFKQIEDKWPPSPGKQYNNTQLRCPWIPVWACALSDANGPITLIAEGILELCVVQQHYTMCKGKGEHSMFVKTKESAPLQQVIDQFYDLFTRCAAEFGCVKPGANLLKVVSVPALAAAVQPARKARAVSAKPHHKRPPFSPSG